MCVPHKQVGIYKAEAKDSLEVAQEALAQLARVIRTPVQAPAAQSEWQWREEFVSLHTE